MGLSTTHAVVILHNILGGCPLRGESHIVFLTLSVVPTLGGGGVKWHDAKKLKLLSIFQSTLV